LVYRGAELDSLVGWYVFGDFGSGTIWALPASEESATAPLTLGSVVNPTAFGETTSGELLIVSRNNGLYRFFPADSVQADPASRLSDTGLFVDTASLQPSPGLIEYTPRVSFWSDGVKKNAG
jgi:hypothetical protein